MPSPTALDALPRADLGEGPWWDADGQRLYWVDITGCRIHRWHPSSGRCDTHEVENSVGFALLDRCGRVVAGIGDAICELEFGGSHVRCLARPDMHGDNRFNDASCDPRGRLWAGTMHVRASRDLPPTGALYRHTASGLEVVEPGIGISNGLGWDPAGRTMYFADTHGGTVWAYDYDLDTGSATNRRPFARVPVEVGVPDGLTVDGAGRVFVAVWRGARLNVYASDGTLDAVIAMPVPHATSCCFGGADLRTLFISTSRRGLSEAEMARYPQSGLLFAMAADVPGLPSTPMAPAQGETMRRPEA